MSHVREEPPREALPRWQFTLAGLFSVVLAWSLYFAMFAALPRNSRDPTTGELWILAITVATSWLAMCLIYRRWRLPQANRMHVAGPALVVGIGVPFLVARFITGGPACDKHWERTGLVFLGCVLYTCGVSTLVSLPLSMLMLVVRKPMR